MHHQIQMPDSKKKSIEAATQTFQYGLYERANVIQIEIESKKKYKFKQKLSEVRVEDASPDISEKTPACGNTQSIYSCPQLTQRDPQTERLSTDVTKADLSRISLSPISQNKGNGFYKVQNKLWENSRYSTVKSAYSSAAASNLRKCPDEEFFSMCLLTHKMKNQRYPFILNLKTHELYEQAQKVKGMNWLKFYDWI